MFMEKNKERSDEIIKGTWKQALYLWTGLNLALTLFFIQSQMFFVRSRPLPHSRLEWFFSGLGFITFLFGLLFFKYYTKLRTKRFLMMSFEERKQSLLVVFVVQFILFETLGLYGVLVSVLTQSTLKSLPFIVLAYLGFVLSFPRKKKIRTFFSES